MTTAAAITTVFREERPAILATLTRLAGDLQVAEDALQEAFAAALSVWPRDGIPARPAAWIMTAARRKAIDRLRRDHAQADRARRLAELPAGAAADGAGDVTGDVAGDLAGDDRLRLIFTCCHPALDISVRVALTLRTLGGLSTAEIARAFLVAEPTMAKRLARAKHKIATARIPYRIPAASELPGRLRAVLRVVYLIFNAGYQASPVRAELCDEAIRLGRLLGELMPDESEVHGLLALMLLHDARRPARTDGFVALTSQDPARWDRARISEGLAALRRARLRGPYQLQAAIAALHLRSPDPDWASITLLYAELAAMTASPVVAVNHAAAAGFAHGADRGLALLEPLLRDPALRGYQPLHATHADLLRRAGDLAAARRAYERAAAMSGNEAEREELRRRAVHLAGGAATGK